MSVQGRKTGQNERPRALVSVLELPPEPKVTGSNPVWRILLSRCMPSTYSTQPCGRLTTSPYFNSSLSGASFLMHLMVAAGFWLDWKQSKKNP